MNKAFGTSGAGRTAARAAAIGLGGLFAVTDPALAQKAAPTAADGPVAGEIDEIVVTSQLRSESLQRVPISAQVFSQKTLTQQNLNSVVALAQSTPSLKVQGSGRSSNFYVRGTGSGESQSFDQSVGTFIDGIYHGRSRYSEATFLDLDHLEVLKGPQSTFFGNNAIAGAFNIVTKKPGNELAGWMRGLISPTSGENGGQYVIEGAATLPLSPDFSVRVAGTHNGQKGWLRNVNTDERAPNRQNDAARATLRYAPGSEFDVTLKTEFGRSRTSPGLIERQTECPPVAPFVAAGFCALNLAAGAPTGLDNSGFSANEGGQALLRTYATVLTVNRQIAGGSTLTSITGYNGYKYNLDLDNDGTATKALNVQAPERYRQFSQELRIASPVDQTVEYLAGVYFQDDRLRVQQSVSYFFLTPNLSAPAALAPLRPFLPIGQLINAAQDGRTYSAFGSLTWNVNDRLKLTGSLRASIVTKDFNWNLGFGTAAGTYGGIVPLPANLVPIANALNLGTAGTVVLDRKDHALMPTAKAQYQVAPDVMAYASYSRGFKAGGFSIADVTAIASNYPFAPEHVNAYEVGLKSQFLDRRLNVNLALFRNDFSDLQVVIQGNNATGGLINFVRNAAASRSQGAELEAQWVVSPIFRVAAAGTYLDSKYRSYPNAGPTYFQQRAGQTVQDLSGRTTLYAPTWSGTLTGTLTVPVYHDYLLTVEGIGIMSSRFQTYSTLDPLTWQPGYVRLDARISLDSPDGRWGVDLIGKNLTDTVIRTFSGYQPTSAGSLFQDRQQFRNVALQVRYKF